VLLDQLLDALAELVLAFALALEELHALQHCRQVPLLSS
jgi:hypothetical protein